MKCQESCPTGESNICCHSCEKENGCIDACTLANCKNSVGEDPGDTESVLRRLEFNLNLHTFTMVDEQMAQKIIGLLRELKTLRQVKIRPATKYLSNSLPVQIMKIEEEFREACECIDGDHVVNKHNAMQEFMDLQGACETMIHIIEPNRAARINEKIQHFQKDNNRGYYI